jgi:hypothetical protein
LALTDASATTKAQLRLSNLANSCQTAMSKGKLQACAFPAELTRAAAMAKQALEESMAALATPAHMVAQRAELWMAPQAANIMTQVDYDNDLATAQSAAKLLADVHEAINLAQVCTKKK